MSIMVKAVLTACLLIAGDATMADAAGRGCPAPGADPRLPSAAAVRRAVIGEGPVRIVCLGSSSTQGVGASGPAASYPARLAAILAGRLPPGRGVEVVNKGVGGETVADNLARLERDVMALRPGLVIWQVGTNDALRGVPSAEVRAGLVEGIARIRAAGAAVVLMDPQPARPGKEGAEAIGTMADLVGEVAAKTGVPLVARHAAMRRWLAEGELAPAALYAPDGLHMSDVGYACLAEAVADLLLPVAPVIGR